MKTCVLRKLSKYSAVAWIFRTLPSMYTQVTNTNPRPQGCMLHRIAAAYSRSQFSTLSFSIRLKLKALI